ncbi:MAG: YkgJ family cysteine cluster protein [Desulfobacterales bacterium]|nr:YkgJ family cysteine cluster protein [Desulfobacterales bacterium]
MAKKKHSTNYPEPTRLFFPEAEKSVEWLPMLLDAYAIADKTIHTSVEKELKKGRRLACAKGCNSCCTTHVTIPVYPLELAGIYWFVMEQLKGEAFGVIQQQLARFSPGAGCPFLLSGGCGIHPMRPLACRHFNVFDRPCSEGEDPFYTRRNDVLTPDEKGKEKALMAMLPYHGITERAEKREVIRKGLIHNTVKNMQEIEWVKLAQRMVAAG